MAGANLRSFGFPLFFLPRKHRLRPLGYSPPLFNHQLLKELHSYSMADVIKEKEQFYSICWLRFPNTITPKPGSTSLDVVSQNVLP